MQQISRETLIDRLAEVACTEHLIDNSLNAHSDSALCSNACSVTEKKPVKPNSFNCFRSFMPILEWLPNYNFRRDLWADVIAGCTIVALQIPQGLAYGRLAGTKPINGLYVSLFPSLVYALFGTSRQISIGTFAVISIACQDVLNNFELPDGRNLMEISINSTSHPKNSSTIETIDILTSLCLLTGVIQLAFGLLQLGIMSIILSETLISAFVSACSIHVFTSQTFAIIGVDPNQAKTIELIQMIPFELMQKWAKLAMSIPDANLTTLMIVVAAFSILIGCKFFFEPWLIRKYQLNSVVVPVDIFLGMPKIPDFQYFHSLYKGAIMIAVISYVSTYSMGKIYSKKHNYEISANQELIALGSANIFSSFFLCYPCSGSLSRSAILDRVGSRTQLASILGAILLALFLLFFSSYLETLPRCILACVIIMALYSTMRKISEVKQAWKTSIMDGVLWMVTFFLIIFFSIGQGLLIAVLFNLVLVVLRLLIPRLELKNPIDDSKVDFVNIDSYDDSLPKNYQVSRSPSPNHTSGWIAFEFQGPIIFINAKLFRNQYYQMIGNFIIKQNDVEKNLDLILSNRGLEVSSENPIELSPSASSSFRQFISINDHHHHSIELPYIDSIIFDCSRLTLLDGRGCQTLLEISQQMNQQGVNFLLTNLSTNVLQNLQKNRFFQTFDSRNCFNSLADAVANLKFLQRKIPSPS